MLIRRSLVAITGLWLSVSLAENASAQKLNHRSFLGCPPPELISQREDWLGWQSQIRLKDLRGKVVWLQFNF
jgi:hypothetical protein